MRDEDWLRLAAAGDDEAAERLVRSLYPSLYRMLRALTRSEADAEDLTQRAVLAVVRKIDGYRGEASLRTWAGRVALTEYGRWARRRRLTGWLSPDVIDVRSPFADFEAIESLRPALIALPSEVREAFLLNALQDLPVEEIAALQRVPVGTVKSRLHTARTRLRQRLAPTSEEKTHVEPA